LVDYCIYIKDILFYTNTNIRKISLLCSMVREGVMLAVKRKFFPILPMPLFIQAFYGRRENAEIKTQVKLKRP
tara:strand:+ start:83 stop:301 length:219 start_codon:yes stop_codon:yes gene_type:complete